ncbi:MAG: ABC transporter permease [Actinomycetia bacterium]|nr:ABC transporter permease [Actinomycetes bacterium]MCP4958079.1 ABC transporter permease [Actinomycetes bacterium]
MRKIIAIALIDLRRLFRERVNFFFFLALPLVLILVLGSLVADTKPRLGVVGGSDSAQGSELRSDLLAIEGASVEAFDTSADLLEALRRDELNAGVIIPDDYDEQIETGGTARIEYVSVPDTGGIQVQGLVSEVISARSRELTAARFVADEGFASLADGLAAAERTASAAPQTTVEIVGPDFGKPEAAGGRGFLAAQELVLFTFLTGLTAATALIQTRQLGIAHRVLSTPTSIGEFLAGVTLGRFLVAASQGLFIIIASALLFGAGFGNWPAAIAIVLLFSVVGTGAAMVMGSVFSNDAQAGATGVFIGLGFAAMGGCMVPLEFFSPTMSKIAHFTPHAWANDAFAELIQRGGGLGDITTELAVLALYGAGLLAISTALMSRVLRTR